jgi:hypothetical protein
MKKRVLILTSISHFINHGNTFNIMATPPMGW